MNINLGSKAARMAIIGGVFFILLVIISFFVTRAISDEPVSWTGIIVFSLLVSGLGASWLFRNIRE